MAKGVHPKDSQGRYFVPNRVPDYLLEQERRNKTYTVHPQVLADKELLERIAKNQKLLNNKKLELKTPVPARSPITNEVGIPIVNDSLDRKLSIIKNKAAIFEIEDNPSADGSKSINEIGLFNPIDTGTVYNKVGRKYGVDPDWLKAIAYMENTHGYYDAIPMAAELNEKLRGQPQSYRPMNVQYKNWSYLADDLGFTEWQVQYRVECNVELAAVIIRRIRARVPNATLSKVATIYNFLGAELVSDYGARVQEIYEGKLWEK